MVEVVAFTGPFTNTGEHGVTRVHLCDVVDQFHDENRLAHAGAAEQTDLTTFGVGGEQVDDFNAGDEDFGFGGLCFEFRCFLVDRTGFFRLYRALFVNRFTDDVEDPAKGRVTNRNRDRLAGVFNRCATNETFGRVHCDGADSVFAKMLGYFKNQLLAVVFGVKCVEDRRQVIVELHVHNGANHLRDFAFCVCHIRFSGSLRAPRRPK